MNQQKPNLFDSLKNRFLNSKLIVGVIFLGIVVGFFASTKESIVKLLPGSDGLQPSLVVSVLDERMYCAGVPVEEDEEVMIQKATLDLAINNTSSRAHIITSLSLEPVSLDGSFFAGEMDIEAVYDVLLDPWHKEVMTAKLEALDAGEDNRPPPQLEPIRVREVADNKYVIPSQSQERFQVRLGLTRQIDFLHGLIRVRVETDGNATMVSDPLSIVVCTPAFKLSGADESLGREVAVVG